MIYIQESGLNRQLQLIEFFAGHEPYQLVLWYYPEATCQTIPIFNTGISRSALKPVTEYSDGFIPYHSHPVKAKPSLISYLYRFTSELISSVDSVCLYPMDSNDWAACAIGHEGICLVKDSRKLRLLKEKGFNASASAPEGW